MRPARPRELQDALNHRLYHPLAWQLALLLARTPLTPNMVSVLGGLMVIAAGFAYWGLAWPAGPLIGMALHMGWHVVDGADGDLARITGRASPIGEMVDGLCDYASHIVLYVLLALVLARAMNPWAAWGWTLAAGISHIVQANHVEVQRRFYLHWIHGVPWMHHARAAGAGPFGDARGAARLFRPVVSLYLAIAAGLTPHAARIDAAVRAAAADPARLARMRAVIGARTRPLLALLKWLGPNPRAIVLGLAMLAGSPLWYFAIYALAMNALLAVSIVRHNRAARQIEAQLAGV